MFADIVKSGNKYEVNQKLTFRDALNEEVDCSYEPKPSYCGNEKK